MAGYFVHQKIKSSVKGREFVSETMLYIVLRDRWCHITLLNAHWGYIDDSKDSFYRGADKSL